MLGAAEYQQKAPPKSYINVLDYESPKELAAYLLKLAADEEEYLSYFWWKVSLPPILLSDVASLCFRDITRSTLTRGRELARRCANFARNSTSPLSRSNPTPAWAVGGGAPATAPRRATYPGLGPAQPGPAPSSSSSRADDCHDVI